MQRKRQYGGVVEKDYPQWMCRWMSALRPKLTKGGSVLIVIRSHVRDGVVSDYVLRTRLALREDGWYEFQECVWVKSDSPFLGSTARLRTCFENVLCFSKTKKPFIGLTATGNYSDRIGFVGSHRFRGRDNPLATTRPSALTVGKSRGTDVFTACVSDIENGLMHPAAAPVSLYEKLILTFSKNGGMILDPFAGSGSVLVAAKTVGKRTWLGFDIKREYVELAAKRLETSFSEHVTVIQPDQPVRLRSDFPDTAKSRRIYFKSRGLTASDAATFEHILTVTVHSEKKFASSSLSVNQIAKATKFSRRTVIRSIQRLRKAGLIETIQDSEWFRGRSSVVAVASSLLLPLEIGPSVTSIEGSRQRVTRLGDGRNRRRQSAG